MASGEATQTCYLRGTSPIYTLPSLEDDSSPLPLPLFPCYCLLVEGGGFEPPKVEPADLQSAPFDHSGTPPKIKPRILRERNKTVNRNKLIRHKKFWSWWTDSNPRPADYKSAALPTELHQHDSVYSVARRSDSCPRFTPSESRPGLLPVVRRTANVHRTFGSSSPKELRQFNTQ